MSKFKLTSSHECLIVSHVSGASSPGLCSVARWNVIKAGLRWPYMTWWAAEKGFKSQGCVPALYQPDLRDWISASPARGLCGFIAVLVVLWLRSSSMRLSSEQIHISTEFNKLIQQSFATLHDLARLQKWKRGGFWPKSMGRTFGQISFSWPSFRHKFTCPEQENTKN